MSISNNQGAGVELRAVVYPQCECGRPFTAHVPDGCHGYRPVRRVEDHGTVNFTPPASWSLRRRAVAMAYYRLERLFYQVASYAAARRERVR